MAKISFKNQGQYWIRLQMLEGLAASDNYFEKVVKVGAKPVADQIRKNLESIPEENFRYLRLKGDKFHVVSRQMKQDLADNFGLAPIERDGRGFVHTKAGFEGYSTYPTKKYPGGVPIPMVARAIESGSSVRDKFPFVYPAVRDTRKIAVKEMENFVDESIKNIFEGG